MHKLKIHGARIRLLSPTLMYTEAVPPPFKPLERQVGMPSNNPTLFLRRHYFKMPLPPHTVVSRVKQRMS
jgi:hypothetical protein